MNLDFFIDYLLYAIVKTVSLLFCFLPVELVLAIGKILGQIGFYLDSKHRNIAYANLRCAFSKTKPPSNLWKIAHKTYENLGQNFIEALILPRIDLNYKNKYIQLEGIQNIKDALSKGRGAILLGMHVGSWEICNAALSYEFNNYTVLINEQKRYPRLNQLLNSYRAAKNYDLILNVLSLRVIVEKLYRNSVMAIAVDQGGREGLLIPFFGKNAPAATAAIRLALKFGAALLPGFVHRKNGPYQKLVIDKQIDLIKTGSDAEDLINNLKNIYNIFESKIAKHSEEYFWLYKVWKYSNQRKAIVLSDGKAGHLKQSQALLNILKMTRYKLETSVLEINFKNNFTKRLFSLWAFFAGFSHQCSMRVLKSYLTPDSYDKLMQSYADIVISTGSSLSAVNLILSRENLAKSIVILKPGIINPAKFDLVIMPKHDRPRPRKNITVIDGALNFINAAYLNEQALGLKQYLKEPQDKPLLTLGLFVGGDTKRYSLSAEIIKTLSRQIKEICQDLDARILITTSRRTPLHIGNILKEEFGVYSKCSLLVIANEKNINEAVGGILGSSDIVLVTSESISMLSEAASCGKYVLALRLEKKKSFLEDTSDRHSVLLEDFVKQGYIRVIDSSQIYDAIKNIWQDKPPLHKLDNSEIVYKTVSKII